MSFRKPCHMPFCKCREGCWAHPPQFKNCQHCHVIRLHQKIERICMYDLEKREGVFLKNTEQTEQDNPCLRFPLFFTSLSTRTWPLHFGDPAWTCQCGDLFDFIHSQNMFTSVNRIWKLRMCSYRLLVASKPVDSFILVRTDLHLEWKYCSYACCSRWVVSVLSGITEFRRE